MLAVRSATRANLPIRYAFSLVSEAPVSNGERVIAVGLLNAADLGDDALHAPRPNRSARSPCPATRCNGLLSRSGCSSCM